LKADPHDSRAWRGGHDVTNRQRAYHRAYANACLSCEGCAALSFAWSGAAGCRCWRGLPW
jgi:hypothetical protein